MKKWLLLFCALLMAGLSFGMSIYIKLPNHTILTLEVESSDSFQQVKYMIQDQTGYPGGDQILVFNGQIPEDGRTFADYNVQKESYLQLILTAHPVLATGNILYVNQSAPASSDQSGSSWENAITDLSSALLWARQQLDASSASWDQSHPLKIYIAEGTYYPKFNADDSHYTEPGGQSSSFVLGKNVQLIGGFPATGNPGLQHRDWKLHPTILSGDPLTPADDSDNASHVLIAVGAVDSAMLDGLTIQGGRSNDASIQVNGENIDPYTGSGMVCLNGSPFMTNLVFDNNRVIGAKGASSDFGLDGLGGVPAFGGGMYIENGSPLIVNAFFTNNQAIGGEGGSAQAGFAGTDGVGGGAGGWGSNGGNGGQGAYGFGGAIYNKDASPTIINAVFYNNQAIGGAGAEGGKGGDGGSGSDAAGGQGGFGGFGGNGGLSWGGGIYNAGTGNLRLINCSFSKNQAVAGMGGQAGAGGRGGSGTETGADGADGADGSNGIGRGGGVFAAATTELQNSILFDNTADTYAECGGNVTSDISYSYLKGNGSWDNTQGADGGHNITGATSPFEDNSSYHLVLKSGSQAIDGGNNLLLPAGLNIQRDIEGNVRIYNDVIDMGAFEFTGSTAPVGLKDFTAVALTGKIQLNWETAFESENSGFYIKKSVDGQHYERVASITAATAHPAGATYRWDDLDPTVGMNYYQLWQTDRNGKQMILGGRSVNYGGSTLAVRVYPNPAVNRIHIILPQADRIILYNITGVQVMAFDANKGDNLLDLDRIAAGVYFIHTEKGRQQIKIIKR